MYKTRLGANLIANCMTILDRKSHHVHSKCAQADIAVPRKRSYPRGTQQTVAMLGKLIRVGRAGRGLTAQELADRAGISRTTLSGIEKARRPLRSALSLGRLHRRRAPVRL